MAEILAGQRLDDASIVTALLHDTVEDTGSTLQDISDRFTPEVAKLVDGVTKLTNMQLSSTETKEAREYPQTVDGDCAGYAGHFG